MAGRPAPFSIFRAMELTNTLNVHAVANVGDTRNDLLAGWHAGVGVNIAVLTGADSAAHLSTAPHTAITGSVVDVPAILNGTRQWAGSSVRGTSRAAQSL